MRVFIFIISILFLVQTASAEIQINFWHAMNGDLQKSLEDLVAKYNSSQKTYKVVPVNKGNYTEAINAAIAAYRGNKQPHLIQVFEVGTMTMMSSGVIVPIQDLMAEQNYKINWSDYIQPVLSYYKDKDGKLMSMPFNSSSPIMYYNKDLFAKAGIKAPPKTWQDVYKIADATVKAGAACGLVVGWQQWILIENFAAIHNLPFATLDNGYAGSSPQLQFNNSAVVKNLETLQSGIKNKSFVYEGRRSDPSRNAFTNGRCAMYLDTSAQIAAVKAGAKFPWAAAALPYNEGTKPQNSIIGGATLWAFKGFKSEENKGVADFISYLGQNDAQIMWHKATGYLPITMSAYKKMKSEGYYKQNPEQEVAILQLTRTVPSSTSRGIRIGGFTQVREIMDEELEKIWAGTATAKAALDSAVERGNRVIQNFAKTVK